MNFSERKQKVNKKQNKYNNKLNNYQEFQYFVLSKVIAAQHQHLFSPQHTPNILSQVTNSLFGGPKLRSHFETQFWNVWCFRHPRFQTQ